MDKTFLHLINGFIRVRERVGMGEGGGGGLCCLGGCFTEGITVKLLCTGTLEFSLAVLKSFSPWNLLTLNGLGSNRTMVG